ncbi:hypothetical protein NDA01_29780 [Trichocoleus desertorum AS-A10]
MNLEDARLREVVGLEEAKGLTWKQLTVADINEEFRSSEFFEQLKRQSLENEIEPS